MTLKRLLSCPQGPGLSAGEPSEGVVAGEGSPEVLLEPGCLLPAPLSG
ncbi:hypothetical protein CYFUS_007445 [Cystobacter fuscus]|uniref:Uncharacterized protein n=1 Tax=Cystobacter fuscus TaxID=43 RepID=A0A250JDI6_9BACT|nr:hypothetical protein CYFUS_007445 [Cystobacter fuscus]